MTTEPAQLRPITPMPMPDIKPAAYIGALPQLIWIEPTRLLVEERYQRNLSDRSVTLIRKIVANWSWSKFKPPICVPAEGDAFFVVDGQHTAIGAASHPEIDKIPILACADLAPEARAAAFIAHNIDRVAVTAPQIYLAMIVAGDEVAVATSQACAAAGVLVRRTVPAGGNWTIGETMAVNALLGIVKEKGVAGGTRLLKILVEAKRGPILACEIRALAAIIFNPITRDQYDRFDIATMIRSKPTHEWQALADAYRRNNRMPQWQAISRVWKEALHGRPAGAH